MFLFCAILLACAIFILHPFKILLISCEDFLSSVYFTVFFCVVFFDAVVFAFAPSLTVSALVVVFAVDLADSAFLGSALVVSAFTGFAGSVFSVFAVFAGSAFSAFTGSAFAGSSFTAFFAVDLAVVFLVVVFLVAVFLAVSYTHLTLPTKRIV